MYTTYMRINAQYSLETVVQIKTQNWDDVNESGYPDEDEMESAGYYGVSYIDGVEVTPEECAAYDAGEYEYIEPVMSLEELWGGCYECSEPWIDMTNDDLDHIICYFMKTILRLQSTGIENLPLINDLEEPFKSFYTIDKTYTARDV